VHGFRNFVQEVGNFISGNFRSLGTNFFENFYKFVVVHATEGRGGEQLVDALRSKKGAWREHERSLEGAWRKKKREHGWEGGREREREGGREGGDGGREKGGGHIIPRSGRH
jgi:hypothetical protein